MTYTDRPSKVSGTVTDEQGAASPTAVVLVFPVDPKKWSGYGASPRTLKSALTTRSGVYTINHLPPGDYYAIALAAADIDGWMAPATLEALATQATRLTVAAGDAPKTLDLAREGASDDSAVARIALPRACACGAAAVGAARRCATTRDVAAGTGSISGTVLIAGEPKQPARRVRVTLTNVARTSPGQTTTTDDGGAFTFHEPDPRPVPASGVQERGISEPATARRGPTARARRSS